MSSKDFAIKALGCIGFGPYEYFIDARKRYSTKVTTYLGLCSHKTYTVKVEDSYAQVVVRTHLTEQQH